jgi:hypothetical protein
MKIYWILLSGGSNLQYPGGGVVSALASRAVNARDLDSILGESGRYRVQLLVVSMFRCVVFFKTYPTTSVRIVRDLFPVQLRVAMTTCVGQGVGKLDGNAMVERGLYLKLNNFLCISDMRETRTPPG